MDFGALPPEINSGRMYAGPGSGPMLTAAVGWEGLAAELHSAATSYQSVVSGLTSGPWLGAASVAMAFAAAPYVAWLNTTVAQAEQAASQAKAAAGAYEAAFAMTVPPPVIAANRALLMALIATNFLGQNTPAITATEAHYAEMWAQDAAAMYGYAAASAAASMLTPFTPPSQTTNPAGLAGQAAAIAQATGSCAGTHAQTTLPQLSSLVSTALQGLAADPPPAPAPTWWLDSLVGVVGVLVMPLSSSTGLFGAMISAVANSAATARGLGSGVLGSALTGLGSGVTGAGGVGLAGAGGVGAPVSAALGQARSVGALSVPSNWAAATPAASALSALPATGLGATPAVSAGASPSLLGGMPLARTAGGGIAGADPFQVGPRAFVMPRPPAAG